jgi:hypothetical protein
MLAVSNQLKGMTPHRVLFVRILPAQSPTNVTPKTLTLLSPTWLLRWPLGVTPSGRRVCRRRLAQRGEE